MENELSTKILSDIIVHTKYARYIPEAERRENWKEITFRNMLMHMEKYPQLKEEIDEVYRDYVLPKKILPSMRSMQFGGRPITRNPTRIYNCAYLPLSSIDGFSELMFLLLGGTGVGYSVQYRHVNKLPKVLGPSNNNEPRRYVIGDSIEGWADSVKVLIESHLLGKDRVRFDFDDIREKGTELVVSGGKAPGPEPLRICLTHLSAVLKNAVGRRLQPIEVHDICCHIADAVLAGGIRRAAMISLFSPDDIDMICAKSGAWYENNPQRGRANNSVILHRGSTTKEEFDAIFTRLRESGSGEPGIYWTNNLDWGTNPCAEIALKPFQFCNLSEVNVSDVTTQEEFNERCKAAALVGTLQAGYTDFHYLRPIWKSTTEKEALIGVGMTGIASGGVMALDMNKAGKVVNEENRRVAKTIKIRAAARTTTVKPSGTTSIVVGCSSGVHAWHSPFYIRRIRVGKDEAIYKYLLGVLPGLVEDDYFNPRGMAVIQVPQKSPKGAITRTESSEDLLQRAISINESWVNSGFVSGANRNNVSCTISVKEDEWDTIQELFWDEREKYNGMSLLPYDGGTYRQAPFEEVTEEVYNSMLPYLKEVDLTKVKEAADNTNQQGELACAGGVCEIF